MTGTARLILQRDIEGCPQTFWLATTGFRTWCDVTKLLGGEDFWNDIEDVIRNNAIKVLFVLSKTSNRKPGPLKELAVANAVAKSNSFKDFVIPLLIDDLPHTETNIELNRVNAVDFSSSWAQGLSQLVAKLEKDEVPKHASYGPTAVTRWWNNDTTIPGGLLAQPERHLSNWFGLQLPEDPRDGLTLFGPLDEKKTFGIRPGVIGTAEGIERFWRWVASIQGPVDSDERIRPAFPGFEAAFKVPFSSKPTFQYAIDSVALENACHVVDRHQRVHQVVRLFSDRIIDAIRNEDERADVWFVVVPDYLYTLCRPQSVVPKALRVELPTRLGPGIARSLLKDRGLFEDPSDSCSKPMIGSSGSPDTRAAR